MSVSGAPGRGGGFGALQARAAGLRARQRSGVRVLGHDLGQLRHPPRRARRPARGRDFAFAAGGAVFGLALLAAGGLTGGLLSWPPGSLLETVVYLLVFALEMGVA